MDPRIVAPNNKTSSEPEDDGRAGAGVGFSVRHNTDPPFGFEETDTLTTANLVYELK
jgi:putative salt-induced outer membrane protein YdiY